jgi:putative ABC transport system ATP-binding protein
MRDVSLAVARGEVVALLGPSGAGKSTLLTAVGLINPPTAGRIVIGGVAVMDGPRPLVDLRAFPPPPPRLRLPEGEPHSLSHRAAERADCPADRRRPPAGRPQPGARTAGLSGRGRPRAQPADALSGGQQQRVAVARALANRPSLLLADEPTAALDRERGRQVMALFRLVAHEQGTGVLVVTHDHRALDVFDRTLEMEDGQLRNGVSVVS